MPIVRPESAGSRSSRSSRRSTKIRPSSVSASPLREPSDLQSIISRQNEIIRDLQSKNELLWSELGRLGNSRQSSKSEKTMQPSRPGSVSNSNCDVSEELFGDTKSPTVSEFTELGYGIEVGNPFLIDQLATAGISERNRDSKWEAALAERDYDVLKLIVRSAWLNPWPVDVLERQLERYVSKDTDAPLVKILMAAGVDLRSQAGCNVLFSAAVAGQQALMEELLGNKADPDSADESGETALMVAAAAGDIDTVNTLMNHSADLSKCNRTGDTALVYAVRKGHTDVVRRFIDLEADLNECTGYGRLNALMYSAASRMCDIEALADATGRTVRGWSPLMHACEMGHLDIVELLVGAGAKEDCVGLGGVTCLMCAAFGGHLAVVRFLVRANCKVNAATQTGKTALMYAARDAPLNVVQALLDAGAEVLARDHAQSNARAHNVLEVRHSLRGGNGWSPLMYAAERGNLDIVRLLMLRGADPNVRETDGKTAAVVASDRGHAEVAEYLHGKTRQGCCIVS